MKIIRILKKKGFTLIEILVVSTIIALLATAGIVTYSQINKQSRDAKRKADLEQIRAALEMYRSDNDKYFPTDTGSFNDKCQYIDWLEDYISSSIPTDPKSTSGYYYRCIVSANDYTVAAYLEGLSSSCGFTYSCGLANCNYCLGPYGQK